MAQYRTCVAAGILLLAVLATAQQRISAQYGAPSGIQTVFTGPNGANTPAVVLGSWAYVGTDQGVVGGSIFSGANGNLINNPPINITTPFPVTTLWNTSATEMVAVTNDTLRAFSGNSSKWNFTSTGFQFDFAAMSYGQYPTPLVWNNTIFIGTFNSNWISGTTGGWSTVYAIDLTTGAKKWATPIPAPYTNYQIQLGDDMQTILVRASNPVETTNIYLLRGVDGVILPFVTTTNYVSASNWLPQFALYNGSVWINDHCGYVLVANVSTNATMRRTISGCANSGFPPALIGGVIYVVSSSYVYAFNSAFSQVGTGASASTSTLQQVVPYGPTQYIFCGPSGLQTYDTTTTSFLSPSSGSYNTFFTPYYSSSCESLAWVNGLLVVSFGSSIYALNVTSATIVWQNQASVVKGVGWITVVPSAGGMVFVSANSASSSSSLAQSAYTSLLTWSTSNSAGWSAMSLSASGVTYFGEPYNVVVVQSYSTDTVTVVGAFNGSTVTTFGATTSSSDPSPFLVGDFACCNGYYYFWCVALVSGKTSFKTTSISASYPLTVSGSTIYYTYSSWPMALKSLDTTAASPAFAAVTLPTPTGSLSSLAAFNAAVIVGKDAAGQAMLFGATDEYTLYGIAIATAATSWAIYTLSSTLSNAQGYGAAFTTNVVQIPGDGNILIGGTRTPLPTLGTITPVQYGLMKFGATSHLFVDIYTYPSVTVTPLSLVAGSSVVLIVGTSNVTATNQNGAKFWNLALGSSNVINGVTLAESSGAVFVSAVGTGGLTFYTLNAYTGAVLWSTASSSSGTNAVSVVNGLVFWGYSTLRVANLVTGQLVGTFPVYYGQVGNTSTTTWAYGVVSGYVFGFPLDNSTTPSASQRVISGSFTPAAPPTTGDTDESGNKLWIIAVVVGFLLVVIVIAVVVSRKKSPPKDQDYVAMNSQAGSV